MLTKDNIEIMKVFTTKRFTKLGIAQVLKKDSAQVRKSMLPLIKRKLIVMTPERHVILNYRKNHGTLAYIESLKAEEFLSKQYHKSFSLFFEEVMKNVNGEFFVMIIFGSAVTAKKMPRDYDTLIIVENMGRVEKVERFIYNASRNYPSITLDTHVVSQESVFEMARKREELNVLNELLNNHVILYGAEQFYHLLNHARQ